MHPSVRDDTVERSGLQGCLLFMESFLREDDNLHRWCFFDHTMRALERVSVMMAYDVRCMRRQYTAVLVCEACIRDQHAAVLICEAFSGQRDHFKRFRERARKKLFHAICERHGVA